jgi:hypothetical protein
MKHLPRMMRGAPCKSTFAWTASLPPRLQRLAAEVWAATRAVKLLRPQTALLACILVCLLLKLGARGATRVGVSGRVCICQARCRRDLDAWAARLDSFALGHCQLCTDPGKLPQGAASGACSASSVAHRVRPQRSSAVGGVHGGRSGQWAQQEPSTLAAGRACNVWQPRQLREASLPHGSQPCALIASCCRSPRAGERAWNHAGRGRIPQGHAPLVLARLQVRRRLASQQQHCFKQQQQLPQLQQELAHAV